MIYKHGAFEHDVHVVEVSHTPEWAAGALLRTTSRILIEGKVSGADQAALKTAITALNTAYLGTQVTSSGLYHSDGTTVSGHVIDTTGLTTENGIVAAVKWVDGGAEYVYKRSFIIDISCVVVGAGGASIQYQNRIARIGDGGPIHRVFPTFGGLRVRQQIYPVSPFYGVESGSKSSRLGVVTVPAPTYPVHLKHDQKQTETGVEQSSDGVVTYFANWSYNYEADVAF
jgi:hypothetical protein